MRQQKERILLDFALRTDHSGSLSPNAGDTRDGDPRTDAMAAVFCLRPVGDCSPSRAAVNMPQALRAYLSLGLIEAAAMAAFFFALKSAGWTYGQTRAPTDPVYRSATTACLSAIIVMQSVNVFLCRSSVQSVWTRRILSNRLILYGVALEIVSLLLINYTPWGNLLLETATGGWD